MTDSYLIQGAWVLTLGNRTQNRAGGDVLVEDGVIAEIGTGLRARGAELIDGVNSIVMPGFVDAHRRCWPSLFKNEGATGAIPEMAAPSVDEVYAGTLISLLGALESGTTTVVDWYDGPESDAHIDAAMRAHLEAGVRSVVVLATGDNRIEVWRRAIERHGLHPSATTSLAAGSPPVAVGGVAHIAQLWGAARDLGLHIHAIGGPAERGVIADLGQNSLLGPDVTVSHGTGLSDADLDAIASANAGIALTPTSDMTTGPGTPPMQDLLDRGIQPGLGVDHEFVGPGDVLAQMRAAISIQHARYFDLKLAGKGGLPNLLSTRDVIRYGTSAGADAVGLGSATGSLEVGKQADLILVRTDRPNIHPINDPIGAVVWGIDTSNLDWMFVGGRALMREGNLVADVAAARTLAIKTRNDIAAKVGGVAAGGVV